MEPCIALFVLWAWIHGVRRGWRFYRRRQLFFIEHASEDKLAEEFTMYLVRRLNEMDRDPFTWGAHWRDILPVCRYADKWFAATHAVGPNWEGLEQQVIRKVLANDDVEMA